MKLKAVQKEFQQRLRTLYDLEEIDNFFYMTLDHFFEIKKISLALNPQKFLNDNDTKTVFRVLDELEKERPIQYILGQTEFCGLTVQVNPSVLIPRPETEELVSWILKDAIGKKSLDVLDIGTGSGCIAIALSSAMENARVFGMDLSETALETSRKNAKLNKTPVRFVEADVLQLTSGDLDLLFGGLKFDIIVSNPPYVRTSEKETIKNNVLKHEPHLALFVPDNDALLFYRKIIQLALEILKPRGELYFEINEYLGESVEQLLIDSGFVDVELKTDSFNKNRMVKGTRS
jgi:release factor glutamine methyltransferase